MLAVVGGNEVTNPFEVTEVYVKEGSSWKLGSLSFTRLLSPSDTPPASSGIKVYGDRYSGSSAKLINR